MRGPATGTHPAVTYEDNLSIAAGAPVMPNLLCSGMYPGESEGSCGRHTWALEVHEQPCPGQAARWQAGRRCLCGKGWEVCKHDGDFPPNVSLGAHFQLSLLAG